MRTFAANEIAKQGAEIKTEMVSKIQDALAKKNHIDDLLSEGLHSIQFNKLVNLNGGADSISSI